METLVVPKYVRLVLIVGKKGNLIERMAVPPWVLSDPNDPDPKTRELPQNTFSMREYARFGTGADIITTTRGVYEKVIDEEVFMDQRRIDDTTMWYRDYSKRCRGPTLLRSLEYQLSN